MAGIDGISGLETLASKLDPILKESQLYNILRGHTMRMGAILVSRSKIEFQNATRMVWQRIICKVSTNSCPHEHEKHPTNITYQESWFINTRVITTHSGLYGSQQRFLPWYKCRC